MLRSFPAQVAVVLVALAPLSACGAAQSAAQRDPMHCERDPTCAKYRGSYADCTRQCADSPPCVDRCREVQSGVDRPLGR